MPSSVAMLLMRTAQSDMMTRIRLTFLLVALLLAVACHAQPPAVKLVVGQTTIAGCEARAGVTWGPAADIARAMGGEVSWQEAAGRLIVWRRSLPTISLRLGSDQINIGPRVIALGASAQVKDGVLVVPVRPLLDAFGLAARWDPATLTLRGLPRLLSVVCRGSANGAVIEVVTSAPCVGTTGQEDDPPRTFVDLTEVLGSGDALNYVNAGGLLRARWGERGRSGERDRNSAVLRVVGDLKAADPGRWVPYQNGCGGRLFFGQAQGEEPVISRAHPKVLDVSAQQVTPDLTIVSATVTDPVSATYSMSRRSDRVFVDIPAETASAGQSIPVAGDFVGAVHVENGQSSGSARLSLDLRQLIRFSVQTATDPDRVQVVFGRKSLAGEVIYLDPGHGGKDSGARGSVLQEKDITLDVAQRLAWLLAGAGAQPMMTRDRDVFIDLYERPFIANQYKCDMFLSIHCNAGGGTGSETYWYQPWGQMLANIIHDEFISQMRRPDRGCKRANFCVIRETNVPSSLIELMFIDHQPDEGMLAQASVRQMAAASLLEGLRQYVSGTKSSTAAPVQGVIE